ncbi:hypothetical protein INR49_023903 [Caranx melampygus]|nr:hypothetical protein INR49_023903 [Caranx melampygus]
MSKDRKTGDNTTDRAETLPGSPQATHLCVQHQPQVCTLTVVRAELLLLIFAPLTTGDSSHNTDATQLLPYTHTRGPDIQLLTLALAAPQLRWRWDEAEWSELRRPASGSCSSTVIVFLMAGE